MDFWEPYECTILAQMNFHLKTCSLITNEHSIAGKFVWLKPCFPGMIWSRVALVIWYTGFFGALVVYWCGALVLCWFGALVILYCGDLVPRWFGGTVIWWYSDLVLKWFGGTVIWCWGDLVVQWFGAEVLICFCCFPQFPPSWQSLISLYLLTVEVDDSTSH